MSETNSTGPTPTAWRLRPLVVAVPILAGLAVLVVIA